jgi:hypothetical protein
MSRDGIAITRESPMVESPCHHSVNTQQTSNGPKVGWKCPETNTLQRSNNNINNNINNNSQCICEA